MGTESDREELFFESETRKHQMGVSRLLMAFAQRLLVRASEHDASKLEDPERETFVEVTPKLRDLSYGSDEYKEQLKRMGPALEHHYQNNSHHPEHSKLWKCPVCDGVFDESETSESVVNKVSSRSCPMCYQQDPLSLAILYSYIGIEGMDLFDIVEMLCDWFAATLRHADGDIDKSIGINEKRFRISPQLSRIFRNTVKRGIAPSSPTGEADNAGSMSKGDEK